jgi:hypothetical protein
MEYFKAGCGVFLSKGLYAQARTIGDSMWSRPHKRKIDFRNF